MTRRLLVAGAAVCVCASLAGCSSGGSKASPPPTTAAPVTAPGNTATTAPVKGGAKPTSAQLQQLQQQLDQAGSALDQSGSAVNGADVNSGKAQEGSEP
jgi:TolA-binding protein